MADMDENCRTALTSVDPTPYFSNNGDNNWAAVRGYLDAVTGAAAAQVSAKYTGVFITTNTFAILESIRLDLGYGSWIHP